MSEALPSTPPVTPAIAPSGSEILPVTEKGSAKIIWICALAVVIGGAYIYTQRKKAKDAKKQHAVAE